MHATAMRGCVCAAGAPTSWSGAPLARGCPLSCALLRALHGLGRGAAPLPRARRGAAAALCESLPEVAAPPAPRAPAGGVSIAVELPPLAPQGRPRVVANVMRAALSAARRSLPLLGLGLGLGARVIVTGRVVAGYGAGSRHSLRPGLTHASVRASG